uniref:Uncharacterized protein n=1 Tax=Leptocylindrus danicus TaxID=163516 RepID=A0A6U2R132_9STRA|mmetsp:Transcript_32570/g.47170  ORF Transcript_32570/g.47170 Transcript_32570/m.47170 type:complete len:164 (+) Transcript_32570:86-577(+)|eukprot:CAMPEP_0116027920 /NCGR_PEP_ID=MMETSP0321-20121206/15023_1 /TAXON_ID=163516 /ORGANISM="Leptocylindrus danicus var. danicus, Strain B650" /LENGTH=163 /DNA_ID=CAMNT_0003501581 /DNA_START=32 /DNA_END=523 /DNA_ORIENTATION=+
MPIINWDFLDNICTCEVDELEQAAPSAPAKDMTGAARNLIRATKLRALKLNEDHDVVNRSKQLSKDVWRNAKEVGVKVGQRVKELDAKHKVTDSFQVVAVETSDAAHKTWKQVDDRHKISDTSSNAFVQGANFLSKHVEPKQHRQESCNDAQEGVSQSATDSM